MSKKETPKKTKKKTKKTKKKSKKVSKETVVGEKSLIYIDYVAKTKEEGKVFDTTLEEVAKKEGFYSEKERYAPMLVAIGWNWLLEALEEDIVGMKVGESKKIEVPPEKGAGPRDPSKVKMIAKTKLAKHGVRAVKGESIEFGQERGVVTAVTGRQVRVDFNNPLAGKTLAFDVTVREIISDPIEKVKAIVKRRIPALPDEKFSVMIRGTKITINLPKESRYIENVNYAEIGIAADALKVHEKAKEVNLCVTFERPEEPKEADESTKED